MNAARSFAHWLSKNAALLHAGHELLLPFTLPHPSSVGFKKAALTPSFGQVRDWTLPLRRGRLVVHEIANGQCIIRLERPSSSRSLELLVEAAEAGVGALAAALVSVGGLGLASIDAG